MADALDHLEVAKLAAAIGGQLKDMDNRTDGALMNANRIDTRKFIQNVVHAANPNSRPPAYMGPQVGNSEEAQLLEMLNNQAIGQVPDISQGSPQLIPMPVTSQPPQQYVPQPVVAPNVVEQRVQYPIGMPQAQGDPMREIAEAVKSIDMSLQALCTVFIVKAKKKKKRKVTSKQQLLQEVPTTNYIPVKPIQPSTQESPQNVS
jgi:hypothetical protein